MMSRPIVTLSLALFAAFLLATPPLAAQIDDFGSKANSLEFHEAVNGDPTEGAQALEDARRYIERIQELEAKEKSGEELSKRQAKKLEKAYDKAIANLDLVLEDSPELAQLRITLGSLQYNRGDYAAARETFDRLLELDPEHAKALEYRRMCDEMLTGGAPAETEALADAGSS